MGHFIGIRYGRVFIVNIRFIILKHLRVIHQYLVIRLISFMIIIIVIVMIILMRVYC